MIVRKVLSIAVWIYIHYPGQFETLSEGEGTLQCGFNGMQNFTNEKALVSVHSDCENHNDTCVDYSRLMFTIAKAVHDIAKNLSLYNNDTGNRIVTNVHSNTISYVEFYKNGFVLQFCSHQIIDFPMNQICNFTKYEDVMTKVNELIAMTSFLDYIGWKRVVFLYDTQSADIAFHVAAFLSNQWGVFVSYNVDLYDDVDLSVIVRKLNLDIMDDVLNITLFCQSQTYLRIFSAVQNIQNTFVQEQMRIQHHSKWIVFMPSVTEKADLDSIELDNVLFFRKYGLDLPNCKYETEQSVAPYKLATLLWTTNGRKQADVGFVTDTGHVTINANVFPNVGYGLNQRKLRVTTIEWGISAKIGTDGNFTGLCFDILNEIALKLNFTYEVVVPPDGAFGDMLPNGTWTGMVGMIQNDKADLVASTLTITTEREKVVDFTYPIIFDYVTIVFAKPQATKWRTLLNPYTDAVYILIGGSLIVVSLIFFLLERWHPKYNEISDKPPPNFHHSFWYMFGALLAQGGEALPTSAAGRTLISSWWIFCIISIAVYSGNLTATLAVNKQTLPFTSLEEMVKQKVYKWGTLGNSVYPTFFKNSQISSYAKIWEGIVEFNKTDSSVLSESAKYHYKKVTEGNYAFIMGRAAIDYETADICDLVILDESLSPNTLAFALSNNSPFGRIVSNEILSLHESGFLAKWKTVRWPQKSCEDQKSLIAKNISAEDMQSAFYLIAIGITISCIVLIIEKVLQLYKNRRRQKT